MFGDSKPNTKLILYMQSSDETQSELLGFQMEQSGILLYSRVSEMS